MWADNETKDDLLGYQVHADLLRDVVLDPKMLPISIGVFGDWGSGKSSLMLLMQESIEKWRTETEEANKVGGAAKKNARVLQIMFNSWQFEDYEDTKLTLIETILSDVIKDIEDHRDFFEKADACLSKIKYLKLGVVVLKNLARKIIPKEIQELLPNKEEWKEISKEDQDLLLDEVKNLTHRSSLSDSEKILPKLLQTATTVQLLCMLTTWTDVRQSVLFNVLRL